MQAGGAHIQCPRCGARLAWPSSLTNDQAAAIAALTRANALDGARYAHEKLGLELTDAKAISFHITRQRGMCHRCHSAIAGSESVCAKCNSLNLDW
jgi:hypothetical protein